MVGSSLRKRPALALSTPGALFSGLSGLPGLSVIGPDHVIIAKSPYSSINARLGQSEQGVGYPSGRFWGFARFARFARFSKVHAFPGFANAGNGVNLTNHERWEPENPENPRTP